MLLFIKFSNHPTNLCLINEVNLKSFRKNEEKSLLTFLLILGNSDLLDNSSHLLSDVQISQKKFYIYV